MGHIYCVSSLSSVTLNSFIFKVSHSCLRRLIGIYKYRTIHQINKIHSWVYYPFLPKKTQETRRKHKGRQVSVKMFIILHRFVYFQLRVKINKLWDVPWEPGNNNVFLSSMKGKTVPLLLFSMEMETIYSKGMMWEHVVRT